MPSKSNYSIKGELHFHNIKDTDLSMYKDMIQILIYNYPQRYYPEIHDSLCKCLQDITCELTDRETPFKPKVYKSGFLTRKLHR